VKTLGSGSGPINQVIDGNTFSLIIFTKDWLADGSPFLVHDTTGAEVLTDLHKGPGVEFTKRADDWMNEGYYNGRLYAIKGEAKAGDSKPKPLGELLTEFGYTPEKTHMYIFFIYICRQWVIVLFFFFLTQSSRLSYVCTHNNQTHVDI